MKNLCIAATLVVIGGLAVIILSNVPAKVSNDPHLDTHAAPAPATVITESGVATQDRSGPITTITSFDPKLTCPTETVYVDNGDGTTRQVTRCIRGPLSVEGYDQFDIDTLHTMSYDQAGAAEALGKRLYETDPETARRMMLRAVALAPDNTMPIIWLSGINYGRTAHNGEPDFDQMQENYVLRTIRDRIDGTNHIGRIKDDLIAAGFSDKQFASLDHVVQRELNDLARIQIEVNGRSTISVASL